MCVGFVVGLLLLVCFVLCFAFSHPSLNRDEDTEKALGDPQQGAVRKGWDQI